MPPPSSLSLAVRFKSRKANSSNTDWKAENKIPTVTISNQETNFQKHMPRIKENKLVDAKRSELAAFPP